jgi:hypothetical protein
MSNLLSQASLVMIPSGYKEDVVYSPVPTDGSGDLSFTRASNGTRINSAGLVEVTPWNLATYSEEFSNAAWSKLNSATITANTTSAPNGTTTADTLTNASGQPSVIRQQISTTIGQTVTFSVYAKCASGTVSSRLRIEENGGAYPSTVEDITVTTEWQRFTVTRTLTLSVTSSNCDIFPDLSQTGKSIYIWGAQLNIGSTAKPYFPTTDRLNVPRLTYQNGGGGCPSLLLEKQSTNLAQYSEQFDNAYWSKTNATISANNTTSPDGTQNADLIIADTTNGVHQFRTTISSVTAQNYTMSIFAKKSGINFIRFWEDGQTGKQCYFNLNTGVATNVDMTSVSIENIGNGWFRCIAVVPIPASGVFGFRVLVSQDGSATAYAGNGTDGVFIWGAQLEASSYATSYIGPTTSSSATRVADACQKTGISSLIGQSEGFIAGEVEGLTNSYGAQSTIMSVSDGTTQNRVMFSFNATTGYVTPRIFKAGSTIFVTDYGITLTQKIKFAIGWGGGRAVCYVNGTQVQETTGLTFFSSGTLTRFGADDGAGSNIGIGKVSEYILGTTNLTNAQLQSLTI